MTNTTQNGSFTQNEAQVTFRLPTLANVGVKDAGQVRLGGLRPVFNDAGKVRLGGLGPVFRIADARRVRLGGLGPIFR